MKRGNKILIDKKFIYIVGAHSRAQTLKEYLTILYPEIRVKAYLVNDLLENDDVIEGIPVKKFDDESYLHTDYPVYIATRGIYHEKLREDLERLGMEQIIPLTVELDIELRNKYVKKVYEYVGRKFEKIDDLQMSESCILEKEDSSIAKIYVASSVGDKPLKTEYKLTKDEVRIQVGAALSEKRIPECDIVDCSGENISEKNRQYCELTALYWIWKNATEDIVGLVHYRRHFLLPKDWVRRMDYHDIDVILPVPLYVRPNLAENFKYRHIPSDWEYMMQYLKENCPNDFGDAKRIFSGNLYSPCNMCIMRRDVLDDLCTWMFPILQAVTVHGGEKEDSYMNRYPGFISERLITYFFEKHREKYHVVYADKNFLV